MEPENFKSFLGDSFEITTRKKCTADQKKRNISIYFNTNYRTEMKLVPINMDYYLLQFDVLKFFL